MFVDDGALDKPLSGVKRGRTIACSDSDSDDDSLESYYSDYGVPRTKMNCPHDIAYMGWVKEWTMKEAVRELVANMIDQSRTVVGEQGLDPANIKIVEAPQKMIIQLGEKKLAEATWKVETCKFIREYADNGQIKSHLCVARTEKVKTQVIQLTNLDSGLPWDSFTNGKSTKGDNKDVIGKHGEGLSAASVVLTRLGCNLSAVCTQNRFTATVGALGSMVCFQVKYKRASTSANPRQPPNSVRFRIVLNPDREGLKIDIGALVAAIRLPVAISAAGIATSRGTLLLDPSYKGKQYNRSIFVADGDHEKCLFGYDFLDPDKTLLQGRDRNGMEQKLLLVECAAILSEAILSTLEVRRTVLLAFKYPPGYKPGESEDKLPTFEDLRDGEHLSPAAVSALRGAEVHLTASRQATVFCAQVPPALQAVVDHQDLRAVFTHPVLHNHHFVTSRFHDSLVAQAQPLSPNLRVGLHHRRIAELLGVDQVLHSRAAHASGWCTFWRRGNMIYVTSPEHLGNASTTGFSEAQEVALYRALQTCSAGEHSVVRIMRLLREGHEHDEAPAVVESFAASDSFSSPAPAKAASTATATSSTAAKLAPVMTCVPTASNTKPATAKTASSTTGAAPGTTTVRKDNGSTQTMPTFARHCGVQTDIPETAAVSGTYTRHASSGMWLHGQSAQQHQELAELIEDSVQTEEGQRRLRRLSGQLYLVASVEQPDGVKK